MSLTTACYARLAADSTLTALLGSYEAAPAIIVGDFDTLPEDVDLPFVVVIGVESDEADDCKVEAGRDQILVIRCYADATGSTLAIDAIAERIRALFHRLPTGLAVGAYIVECSGPIPAPTDASLYGRQIDVRVMSLA